MTRRLIIAAGPALSASLAEQSDALGSVDLRRLAPGEEPAAPWPDAVLLDAACCDAGALAEKVRERGFLGPLVIIADGDANIPEADAILVRPFRLADLIDALECPGPRPHDDCDGARLTEKEAAIVNRLAEAEGAVISKAALLADVWGYGPAVSTRTLETHIHRLRRKIETDPACPRRLLTDEGGYRLVKLESEGQFVLSAAQKSGKTST